MSILETTTVDAISIPYDEDIVVLTIFDHLRWDENEYEHLIFLQDKINSYLRFLESDEVDEFYPAGKGKEKKINVVGKYDLSANAAKFYQKASEIITEAGFSINFTLTDDVIH